MSIVPKADRKILRALGDKVAAAAADPVNDERREVYRRIADHEKGRPSVSICQEPWSELNQDGELDLYCTDEFCREIELGMRRSLYKWRHHPGDRIMSAVVEQPYCVDDSGFGLKEVIGIDPGNCVVSRHFDVQIKDVVDIAKIKAPVVTHDERRTEECYQKQCEIFDGILDVRKSKSGGFWFAPWDQLVQWTGIQEVLMDLSIRPGYVHKLVGHLVDCWIKRLDQFEEQGLLAAPARNLGVHGAAQIFSAVSPAMHREFSLQHEARFLNRFGRVSYGCCEPMHAKVDICAECLPNLFKITMSPFVDFREAVNNVRNRFIFFWKPDPSFLAYERWDPDLVRADIREKLAMAMEAGCFVEILLADISTVRNEPWRLTEWERIAMEEAQRFAI